MRARAPYAARFEVFHWRRISNETHHHQDRQNVHANPLDFEHYSTGELLACALRDLSPPCAQKMPRMPIKTCPQPTLSLFACLWAGLLNAARSTCSSLD
jgi:hypothetical protein